jgi:FixJ family two-component response regulator
MTAGPTTGARLISIIDDDQSVRDGIVDLVTALGFDALAFASPEHFLQSGDFARTSCLITDVRMSGMTGLELHDRLVASGTLIPTIVMTAFPTEVDRKRAMQAGVIRYMAKPIDNNELAFCIWSALGKRSASER